MGESDQPFADKLVRVINGVPYVNDAEAVSAEDLSKALAAFDNIYLIAGGQKSESGLEGIQPILDKIRHVYLIGEAAEDFSKWLTHYGVANTDCRTIDIAVIEAHAAAQHARGEPGGAGTVLYSPATQAQAGEDPSRNYVDVVGNLSVETPE